MKKLLCKKLAIIIAALVGVASPALADEAKIVHGPLDIPDGQRLTFVRNNNNVNAEFTSPDSGNEQENSVKDATFPLGDVSIVAVFYQDIDLGGNDEVVVMYRDAAGNPHLRAWGNSSTDVVPLVRFTPALEQIAKQLKKFNIGEAQKAVNQLPPQQYLITSIPDHFQDPVFKEVLLSPEKYPSVFLGYVDEGYDKVTNRDDAAGYSLAFPDKYIERENAKGKKTKYTLTLDFYRGANCGADENGYGISAIYYSDITVSGEPKSEGPTVSLSIENCQLVKRGEGQYQNNKLEGEWVSYSDYAGKGHFHAGEKEGFWEEYDAETDLRRRGNYHKDQWVGLWQAIADNGEVVATENYDNNSSRDGFWQQKKKVGEDDKAHWVVETQGNYVHGIQEGIWQEQMTTKPHYINYLHGLYDGEVRVTTPEGKKVAVQHYVQGLLQGKVETWLDDGRLESQVNYVNGRKQGREYSLTVSGSHEDLEINSWKAQSEGKEKLCAKLTDQFLCNQEAQKITDSLRDGEWRTYVNGVLKSADGWCDDERCGHSYKFSAAGALADQREWNKGDRIEDTHYTLSGRTQNNATLSFHSVTTGARDSVTRFHEYSNNLDSFHYQCSRPDGHCGTEYNWYPSGVIGRITEMMGNRRISFSDWKVTGDLNRQVVRISADKFAERYYFLDRILYQMIRPAETYHDSGVDITVMTPGDTSVNYYYDEDGNEVKRDEMLNKWGGILKNDTPSRQYGLSE